jgi:large subunit ribosomal protein L21
MMYAVIRTGGKQYRVQEGDVLRVEKLETEVGQEVVFEDVLLVGEGDTIKVGSDIAKGSVKAVVTEQGRDKKVVIFKKRRRKNYRLTKGHRQSFTAVKIGAIGG